jgi:hypothetical protein
MPKKFSVVRKDYTAGDLHVNQLLTNIQNIYLQNQEDFFASKIFPNVPVKKQSDRYVIVKKGAFFRVMAQQRAAGTESAGGSYDVDTTPSYFCTKYAFHKDVDDDSRANYDSPVLDPDRGATLFVTQQLLLIRERIFTTNFLTPGLWTTTLRGTGDGVGTSFTKWDDYVADPTTYKSNPIVDVDNWKLDVKRETGKMPNRMGVSLDVHVILKNHPVIKDVYKYTQKGVVTEDMLAEVFGVKKYVVMSSVVNTGLPGEDNNDFAFFANDRLLLCYAPDAPSIEEPSAGYTFSWTGYLGATSEGTRIKKFRMEQLESDRVEGELAMDMKICGQDLGLLAYGIITT